MTETEHLLPASAMPTPTAIILAAPPTESAERPWRSPQSGLGSPLCSSQPRAATSPGRSGAPCRGYDSRPGR
jgi:hypothetical protein